MELAGNFEIRGCRIIFPDRIQEGGRVKVAEGRIAYAGPESDDQAGPDTGPRIQVPGWYLAPGLIDLQLNGAYGFDFTEAPGTILDVARRLPEYGVTAFLPTFITSPLEEYAGKLSAVAEAQGKQSQAGSPGARVLGAHVEGPFLSPESKGAHRPDLFCDPTPERLAQLIPLEAVRLLTLAPEREGGLEAVRWLVARNIVVSVGHSGANAAQAQAALEAGVGYATHLYNAMPPLHHRRPGLIGVLLTTDDVPVGLIADGIHSDPLMVRLAYRLKGAHGLTLVTDAMAAMGMPDGDYNIGDQYVKVRGGTARLRDGTLAGSVLTLDRAIRNMLAFSGCSLPEAVRMASATPAGLLGLGGRTGRVQAGLDADLILLDEELNVQATFIQGKLAWASEAARQILEGRAPGA